MYENKYLILVDGVLHSNKEHPYKETTSLAIAIQKTNPESKVQVVKVEYALEVRKVKIKKDGESKTFKVVCKESYDKERVDGYVKKEVKRLSLM